MNRQLREPTRRQAVRSGLMQSRIFFFLLVTALVNTQPTKQIADQNALFRRAGTREWSSISVILALSK